MSLRTTQALTKTTGGCYDWIELSYQEGKYKYIYVYMS